MSALKSDQLDLAGKTAIVTGAGSGVGRAVSVALAERGAAVTIVGRRVGALEGTASLIRTVGSDATVCRADVADEAAVNNAVATTVTASGSVDMVICCAGIGVYGSLSETDAEIWRATQEANLTGVFLISRAVFPHMATQGFGAIIAISSGAGKHGYASMTAYSASKFGLMGLMQALAAEGGPLGIKVSTIVPGSILTDFGGRTADVKARETGGKKYLLTEDVVDAVLFLLSQRPNAWTQEMNLWPF